jgi:sugar lactone lactonase YvrE
MDYRLEDGTPAFRNLLQMLEPAASGFSFTEGPVWRGDDLLFSDIPNSRTVRYRPLPEGPEITTFRHPTNNANGLTLDRQGNLLACEHTSRSLTRVDAQGLVTTLAAAYEGKRLNSPNVCTGPGGVWILNDAGRLLGGIVMPEVTANLAWAGPDWRKLFLTASTSLYRMQVRVPGIPIGPSR